MLKLCFGYFRIVLRCKIMTVCWFVQIIKHKKKAQKKGLLIMRPSLRNKLLTFR
jgi:hypothetical protein